MVSYIMSCSPLMVSYRFLNDKYHKLSEICPRYSTIINTSSDRIRNKMILIQHDFYFGKLSWVIKVWNAKSRITLNHRA